MHFYAAQFTAENIDECTAQNFSTAYDFGSYTDKVSFISKLASVAISAVHSAMEAPRTQYRYYSSFVHPAPSPSKCTHLLRWYSGFLSPCLKRTCQIHSKLEMSSNANASERSSFGIYILSCPIQPSG